MTKVEKEIREQLMEELHCRVHSNSHNRNLLDRKDLGEVIDRAMAGVTLLRIDHKASYQQWVESCNKTGERWWLHVGPVTYKRIYNNAVYFSHIIGYTGEISTEELTALNEAGGAYSAGGTDHIRRCNRR